MKELLYTIKWLGIFVLLLVLCTIGAIYLTPFSVPVIIIAAVFILIGNQEKKGLF